ncbi:UDP-glucose pyrophosphorylase [Bacillus oleivorans]|uniref:UTP--glucose-1-phosphate uridylyltransferase n=2 Tax=Bacillus oleivorans TaxID=1448271 RepID=A0A285CI08_9BACI|nr:UDP-glucose pyrophosphorylase [Bacillus oleivorans]
MIKKAIIPAAGLGTRFLPATKAMPKEMLPIVDKPTIQYIVEEAVASGIKDLIIVTGKGKRAIEDHFDRSYELEQRLLERSKIEIYKEIKSISDMIDVHYIRQKEPKGLGHAIWSARHFIGNEPFAVLLGDIIINSKVPCLAQLINTYNKFNQSVIGLTHVPDEDVNKYGIVNPYHFEDGLSLIQDVVEKPHQKEAPSNLAILGRYILSPKIFDLLEKQEAGKDGEVQLTDAIRSLIDLEPVYGLEIQDKVLDTGNKLGFIKATIDIAVQREDLRTDLIEYLQEVLKEVTINQQKASGINMF